MRVACLGWMVGLWTSCRSDLVGLLVCWCGLVYLWAWVLGVGDVVSGFVLC